MKILITGAAGFIGSHLTDNLLSDGHIVVGLDNFDAFYPRVIKEQNIARARSDVKFTLIEADIRDAAGVRKALKGSLGTGEFNAIVHLAAKAGVRPSIENPKAYQETNVAGTQNLLEFAREYDVKQFVFASSSSVYGVNPNVPWKEHDHGLQPISPYASTKVSGELLGHVYSHLYGIRFLALRFFTVYGPRQRPDLAIHKFARLMLAGRSIPFFGDGSTRRDYTYIDDLVSGIVGALHYSSTSSEIFNIGNDRSISLNELVAGLERSLGHRAVVDRQPEQPGDVPQTWASVEKARRLLDYRPKTELHEGLALFSEWLLDSSAREIHSTARNRTPSWTLSAERIPRLIDVNALEVGRSQ